MCVLKWKRKRLSISQLNQKQTKKYKTHGEKNPDIMHNPDLQNKKASICYAGMIKHRFLIIGTQTLYFKEYQNAS